jgi:hypothetical protein
VIAVNIRAESVGVDMRGNDPAGGRVVLMMSPAQRAEAIAEMVGQMTDADSRALLSQFFPELTKEPTE